MLFQGELAPATQEAWKSCIIMVCMLIYERVAFFAAGALHVYALCIGRKRFSGIPAGLLSALLCGNGMILQRLLSDVRPILS